MSRILAGCARNRECRDKPLLLLRVILIASAIC
ncbi:Hypothetical protein, putative [Bodo saltans]|uniref:Uncharacterized protein n=1 Tax=Bodo saltans TaxID=75058 RepID=A0A0S4JQM1_BODSA|nr:Hypothetical protein, putative [Bodo saltans]|eukprot:CUG92487.1 Hypothetical protein, putative [Bodo saltans]